LWGPTSALRRRRMSSWQRPDEIAETISRYAIRRGSGAAWIGLVSLPDSDVSQLAVLGRDLYSGSCGIATFLAAHAMTTRNPSSTELALAAVSHLRAELRGRGAARLSRLIGVGGATGLGSIVYALTVMSKLMGDNDLLTDAHRAAVLIGDDLIAADKQLRTFWAAAPARFWVFFGFIRTAVPTMSLIAQSSAEIICLLKTG